MNIDYKLIGKRIKEARLKAGYTQELLAEKLDVSVGYVSQVERGITKISLDLLAEISTILNCDISALIVGTAVSYKNYLNTEINNMYMLLNTKDKKILFDFIKLLIDNKDY